MIKVLLVDDDLVDRMAVLRGFSRAGLDAEIQVASDGAAALEILRSDDASLRMEHPFLVLLDLNMPGMGGLAFLEEVRKDPTLRRTIIFVLTTSDSDEDRLAAYEHLVAGYVLKSKAGRNFEGLLAMLQAYWSVVILPNKSDGV
ncbi:Response regulator rcp1 [Planctomycetes bacterium Poly30]|uniref:Response regulator rcp1 n=1 Tax=Saltatorellus ferox TaxID=2528018 RepID=A0A518F0D3_9BACT|nr:Response regulator rcp1 [Planctomycetes bacterium Poly30]